MSSNAAWVSKFQAAQHENHMVLTRILNELKSQVAMRDPGLSAKESQTLMNQQLKKYHAHISKSTKRMDAFQDESMIAGLPLHEGSSSVRCDNDPYLNFCIDHLCYLGKRKTMDSFMENGGDSRSSVQSMYIDDIYDVIQALQVGSDLSIAEDWVLHNLNAENIDENTADRLTYCIAKTKFLALLSTATSDNSNYSQALTISKALFPVFYSKNIEVSELNELMCCLLFSQSGNLSPKDRPSSTGTVPPPPWLFVYPHLTTDKAAQQACRAFRTAAAVVHGLAPVSALHILLRRGFSAATILNGSNAPAASKVSQSWEDLEHVCIPVLETNNETSGVDDAPKHIFHSVFTCPVSRELATQDNLPVLLQCGHVVLYSSMKSLPSSRSGRFKCPTCYHEMKQDSCLALHL